MNKFEANLALLSITLCWGVQYLFLQSVPASVSVFGFMALTNGLGLLILCLVFLGELKNIAPAVFLKGFLLSLISITFNALMISGAQRLEPSTTAFAGTLYVVILPVFLFVFYKERIRFGNALAMTLVILGMAIATGLNIAGFFQGGILLILIGNVFFAGYIILLDYYAKTSSPSHLAITQMLFSTILSFVVWVIVQPTFLSGLENTPAFWSSVLIIALFVRAYSTVMQVYAQRYASPLGASLIFSTEIVFTILFSISLPIILGKRPVYPSINEIIGCAVLVLGVVISNLQIPPFKTVICSFLALFGEKDRRTFFLLGTGIYVILNICFRATFTVDPIVGPSAIMLLVMGIIFGIPGIVSIFFGSILADLIGGTLSGMTIFATLGNVICASGVYLLWGVGGYSKSPQMKNIKSLLRLCVLYALTCAIAALVVWVGQIFFALPSSCLLVFLLYYLWGILFGIPILIVLTSIFGVSPKTSDKQNKWSEKSSFSKSIENKTANIGLLCDLLSAYCEQENLDMKRTNSVVLAVEEMLINIIENAYTDNESHLIEVTVRIQDVILIRIQNAGVYFNPINFKKKSATPFHIKKLLSLPSKQIDEDNLDMIGIMMVTKMAIKVEHKLQDGKNILTILI